VTGWGQDSDKQRALAAGFDHHLKKPSTLKNCSDYLTPSQDLASTRSRNAEKRRAAVHTDNDLVNQPS
jgi:CheY-like chemotaxis protein